MNIEKYLKILSPYFIFKCQFMVQRDLSSYPLRPISTPENLIGSDHFSIVLNITWMDQFSRHRFKTDEYDSMNRCRSIWFTFSKTNQFFLKKDHAIKRFDRLNNWRTSFSKRNHTTSKCSICNRNYTMKRIGTVWWSDPYQTI